MLITAAKDFWAWFWKALFLYRHYSDMKYRVEQKKLGLAYVIMHCNFTESMMLHTKTRIFSESA